MAVLQYIDGVLRAQTGLVTATLTSNGTVSVPAAYAIMGLVLRNTTANAITGGVRIGTTDGGIDVAVAIAVGASAIIGVPDATVLKKYFSASAATTLYIQAVTSWNSASLNVAVVISKVE